MGNSLDFKGHQGDVGLWQAAALPEGLKKIKGKILHKGEGQNSHTFTPDADVVLYEDTEGNRWFSVGPKGATITHEEHKTQVFPPGTVFKTVIERQRNPYTEAVSRVED